ncbi:MAG: MFS transporter [Porticoccaceae bacterium]|nr:MFS transporter [Porticoccaceae bacterium]
MSPASSLIATSKSPFDSWRSIVISLYMTLVGYGVLVGIPVISTAWVTLLGFSEVEVGRVAGADLGGLSLGAIVTSLLISRVNRRWLVVWGLALAVLANGLCITVVDYNQVLWLRLLAGFGSGIYTAVAVASLGASSKPARAYNAMLFAFAFSQALEMHFLPLLSMAGIYWVFICCFLMTLLFIRWIPAYADSKAVPAEAALAAQEQAMDAKRAAIPNYVPWLCLAAMVITYINIGSYWTYIELAALSDQATPSWINQVLVWSSFCSLIGCAFATVLSNRFGLLRPLLVALFTMGLIVGLLANGITDTTLLISVFSFNLLWIFIDVYQMSTIANVDLAGKYAALMPAAQGLGQIIGPNLAASILGLKLGYSAVFLMCSGSALLAMLIYGFLFFRLKTRVPSLAYAT